jgi:hypothetical protein
MRATDGQPTTTRPPPSTPRPPLCQREAARGEAPRDTAPTARAHDRPSNHSGPSVALGGRQRFCTSASKRPVHLLELNIGAVAYRAMWGMGVGPPSAWNPSI